MATWQSANFSALLPSELTALTDSASTVAGSAATVLDAIKTAADAAKSFLIAFPAFDYLQGLDAAVTAFRNEFLNFGMYSALMWDYPLVQLFRSGSGGESFNLFVNDLAESFSDISDPNVPPFSSDAAMLVIVGGFGGLPGALELLKTTAAAFSWWEELDASVSALQRKSDDEQLRAVEEAIAGRNISFDRNPSKQTQQLLALRTARKDLRELIPTEVADTINKPTPNSTPQEVLDFISAVNAEIAASSYPDWQELPLRTFIPPLVDVVDQAFDPLVEALATGQSILANIEALIDNLNAKITALNDIISRIAEYIAQLDALLSLTGLYALFVTSSDGVQGLATELATAENPPFEGVDGFYFGTALVAGGVAVTPFSNLFAPVGS